MKRGRWDNEIFTEDFLGITANAAHQRLENKNHIPSFALDGWIFNAERPTILNIPAMSFLVAHEIFHGFDSKGHKYDHEGICVFT